MICIEPEYINWMSQNFLKLSILKISLMILSAFLSELKVKYLFFLNSDGKAEDKGCNVSQFILCWRFLNLGIVLGREADIKKDLWTQQGKKAG